jgi:Domain of unknown function (DUF4439)
VTSPSAPSTPSSSQPSRPADPANAALFDAVAGEHAVIYGYGLVSAHSTPDVNDLVAAAMAEHRARREQAITRLTDRNVTSPLAAAGYQMPLAVDSPVDAAKLAVRMEEDTAATWRAVLERASTNDDRAFAVTALSESAVTAAKWRAVVGTQPTTVAFPGGSE